MIRLLEYLLSASFAVIPITQMRYVDVGDWIVHDDHTLSIIVADTGSRRYNFLIGLHELIEAKLCVRHGIEQSIVDEWDMKYDALRTRRIADWVGMGERVEVAQRVWPESPGDCPLAPYHREHTFATKIEWLFSLPLLVSWDAYDGLVMEMCSHG